MIDPKNTTDIVIPAEDGSEKQVDLPKFGGSKHEFLNVALFSQAGKTGWRGSLGPGQVGTVEDPEFAMGALLMELKPEGPIEGMMVAQMIGVHNAAMECRRRAMLPNQDPMLRQGNLNQANKLTRSYATLVQALDKHRGKGQQKVVVEHVHVHEGGQAIVGAVSYGQTQAGPQTLSLTQSTEAAFSPVWEGVLKEREGVSDDGEE